jgi:hypothetical protein
VFLVCALILALVMTSWFTLLLDDLCFLNFETVSASDWPCPRGLSVLELRGTAFCLLPADGPVLEDEEDEEEEEAAFGKLP